ncbi:MAG: coiled-coil domain-containing protein [Promethearchaeota archaeon]
MSTETTQDWEKIIEELIKLSQEVASLSKLIKKQTNKIIELESTVQKLRGEITKHNNKMQKMLESLGNKITYIFKTIKTENAVPLVYISKKEFEAFKRGNRFIERIKEKINSWTSDTFTIHMWCPLCNQEPGEESITIEKEKFRQFKHYFLSVTELLFSCFNLFKVGVSLVSLISEDMNNGGLDLDKIITKVKEDKIIDKIKDVSTKTHNLVEGVDDQKLINLIKNLNETASGEIVEDDIESVIVKLIQFSNTLKDCMNESEYREFCGFLDEKFGHSWKRGNSGFWVHKTCQEHGEPVFT